MTKFCPASQSRRSRSFDEGLLANQKTAGSTQNPLTRLGLFNLRLRALRRRVWFRVLSRVERSLIDLVLRTVRKVRSSMLACSLIIVVKKLLNGMESQISRQTRTIGLALAQRLSRIAQGWGNRSAKGWVKDSGFLRYLAASCMNQPP